MRGNWRLMCLMMVPLCVGCERRPATVVLQGEVTYQGRPVEKGTIDFLPVEGTAGPSAVATIEAGRYELAAKSGLLPNGTYQVRVVGLRKTGKVVRDQRLYGDQPMELEENFIPASCNSQSTLKVRVADLPDMSKVDFRLSSR